MRSISLIVAGVTMLATPALADMGVSFTWGDIPKCTTGRPGKVPSPKFVLSGVPAGTSTIEFRLTDLDVPSYNHGGARLRVSGSGTVPFGTFTYKSPCPPSGVHSYEWKVTARNAGGDVLESATARRDYPE